MLGGCTLPSLMMAKSRLQDGEDKENLTDANLPLRPSYCTDTSTSRTAGTADLSRKAMQTQWGIQREISFDVMALIRHLSQEVQFEKAKFVVKRAEAPHRATSDDRRQNAETFLCFGSIPLPYLRLPHYPTFWNPYLRLTPRSKGNKKRPPKSSK